MCGCFCGFREELLTQRNQRCPAHQEASTQQDPADAECAQTLDLAIAAGEAFGRGLERPAHGGECEDVADQVGQAVYCVGEECWNLHVRDSWTGVHASCMYSP
jgi:hypothetical protein